MFFSSLNELRQARFHKSSNVYHSEFWLFILTFTPFDNEIVVDSVDIDPDVAFRTYFDANMGLQAIVIVISNVIENLLFQRFVSQLSPRLNFPVESLRDSETLTESNSLHSI